MKTNITKTLFCIITVCSCTLNLTAQNPPKIKNAAGAEIQLGPIPKVVTPIRTPTTPALSTFRHNLSNGGTQTVSLYKAPISKPFELRKGLSPVNGGDPAYSCTNMNITAESGNFELSNFAPTDFIYAGGIVDGTTVTSGEYRQIAAARNPLAISISLTNGGTAPVSSAVNNPNLATVREAVNQLLAGNNFSQGVEVGETKVKTVYSSEDIAVMMDVHARALLGSGLSSAVSMSTEANKITVVKVIKQRFYSVDVVPPTNSQDFFTNPNTQISPTWTYVSSVKYGRIGVLVMTFESKSQEINVNLEAKIQGFIGSVSNSFDQEIVSNFKSLKIQAFQLGGAPMNIPGGLVASLDAAKNIFQRFDNWTKLPVQNPQPIAYSLRFVQYENGGPAIASLQSTLNYVARRCIARQPRYEVTLKEIKCINADDSNGDEDIYGTLSSKAYKGNNAGISPLFNQPETVLRIVECSNKSLSKGESYSPPNNLRTYDVPAADLDARIIIGGDLDEDDNCGALNTGSDDEFDDENGARTQRTIFFKNIGTTPTTVLFDHKSGGSHVQQVWVLKKTYL